ncbi:MAG: UDP-N-acetylmuramate dehydrogenase [bacterium]|nr:UDP-N-acetylmuramate dehydrogenase [bacterium]
MHIEQDIPLAPFTSLRLGGAARFLARCSSDEDLREALAWAAGRRLPVHVLGGGSNTVFADAGFAGLVIHVGTRGIDIRADGDAARVTAAAGEDWDQLVIRCIDADLSGVECLSGIPGLVGATPMQNVGAYGQEVSESIVEVQALSRDTLEPVIFAADECGFSYRTSRFKAVDRDRFLITAVSYRLCRRRRPEIRYADVTRRLQEDGLDLEALAPGRVASMAVRDAVIAVRRAKSMILDPADPNTRSAGSFFVNPVLTQRQLTRVRQGWQAKGQDASLLPAYATDNGLHKVPAAWLVEQAGFPRGTRRGQAGISTKHALALVSHGDSATDLLALAAAVTAAVRDVFGVTLEREPVYAAPGEPRR